jgi:predicted TIM-barrel fold metal-dependent hydrolase
MRVDIHTHCDTTDPAEVKAFADMCVRNDTVACIYSVGPRCDHHYCTNEETLSVAKSRPDVLVPFAFVDLWDTVDADEIDKFAEQGFRGLKCISPYYQYDHDLYMPVYQKAEEFGLPIVFHTGLWRACEADVLYKRPMLTNMHPLTLDRIARSFPKLKIVMAHMGTTIFRREGAELVRQHQNLYADLAGSGSWLTVQAHDLADLLTDSHVEIDTTFRHFRKLLLGSDSYIGIRSPFEAAQDWYSHTLARVGVPEEIKKGILGGTAAEWLGL